MLHKSFKSGKCKTSLKLAVARIKLLKNKRDAQVKHLRRELAQLVESGQEKTARIRVEHVVREEKTMAAYDLLEIYCELIVARLPIIESQKNCPIDLKEAIASVIFAAPRCADIPELLDVRKHFTAKYGKEFVTSALELRPECGVGRMMVEKLSANAPNGETKMKILAAIAQEHNINWDPASLEDKDSKPTNDFLNGPSTFETASKTTFKHPDAQLPPDPGRKYESSTDLPDHRANIPPLGSHFSASTETSASTRVTTAFSPEPRASESRMGQQEYRRSSSRDENILNKHNWNLEFKDATAAAQAAAESAERASMAARAAVELSSHENNMRQYSTDSGFRNEEPRTSGQKYQEFVTKDSVEVVSGAPGSSTEIRNPRMQNQSKDRKETFPGAAENRIGGKTSVKRRPDKSISSESNVASIDNETPVVSSQKADRYYEKRSSPMESISPSLQGGNPEKAGSVDVESRKQQSSQSEVESLYRQPQDERSDYADNYGDGRTRKEFSRSSSSSVDGDHDDFTSNMNPVESLRRRSSQSEEESFYRQPQKKTSDYTDNHGDGRSRKQSSRYSSSHTSADGDHHDVISTVHPNEYFLGVDDNSLFSNDQGNKQVGDEQSVFFDESGSDEDYTADFAAKDNEHGSSLYFPSPVRESPQYLSTDRNTWNPIVNRGKSVEKQPSSEKHFVTEVKPPFKSLEHQAESEAPSQSNDLAPLAFDDSDGLSSESENDDLLVSGKTGSGSGLHNSFPRSPSSPKNDKNHSLPVYSIKNEGTSTTRKVIVQSYSDDLKFEEVQLGRNQDLKQNAVGDSSEKYGFSDTLTHQPFSGQRKSMKSDDSRQESFHQPEIDEQPLQTSKFTSAKQLKVEENPSTLESDYSSNSESEQGFNFTKFKGGFRNKGFQHPPYSRAPLGGTSLPSQNQSTVDSPYSQKMHVKAQKESSSATSKSVFDSDSDDSYEKLPRQAIGGHRHRDGKHDDAHKESPSRTVGRRNHLNGRHDDDHEESAHSTVFRRSSQDGRHGDDHEESPRQAVGRRSSMDGKHDDAHEESPRQNVGRRSSMDGKRDDAHEDSPNRTVGRRSYVDGKLSRRTKDFLRQSGTSTSEVVVTPDAGMGRNTSRSSATEPHWKRQSEPMRSGSAEDPMLSATTAPVQQKPPAAESKPAVYRETSKFAPPSSAVDQSEPHRKPQSEPMRSGSAEDPMLSATTASVQQKPPKPAAESKPAVYQETSKFAPPSSAVDQSSNVSTALPKTASSGSSESSNTSSTSDASKSKNNPLKKDSHVHPNLPDYDTLASHFRSLRANRR